MNSLEILKYSVVHLILLLLFNVSISISLLFLFSVTYDHVYGDLDLDLKINPDSVNVGDKLNLILIVNNSSNNSQIDLIEIILPWTTVEIYNSTDKTGYYTQNVYTENVTVPEKLKPGTYNIIAIGKANNVDHITTSEVEIHSLQGIPFSGEIPLSVIAIFIPGIVTYFIIVYFVTSKFDRGYLETGIISIGFGLLVWTLVERITNRSILLISQSQPIDYFYAFMIGGLLGLISILCIIFSKRISSRVSSSLAHRKQIRDLLTRGYTSHHQSVWKQFIEDQRERMNEYSNIDVIMIQVITKMSFSKVANFRFVSGILTAIENNSPYHVTLMPRYFFRCTKIEFIEIMRDSDIKDICIKVLKQYRSEDVDNIFKYLEQRNYIDKSNDDTSRNKAELIIKIICGMLEINFLNTIKLLQDENLKFGPISKVVIKKLLNDSKYKNTYNDHLLASGRFMAINGDSIDRVEVLYYTQRYTFLIEDQNLKIELPKILYSI